MSSESKIRTRIFIDSGSRYADSLSSDFAQVAGSGDDDVEMGLFVVEADRGLSAEDIAEFQHFRDLQLPTLILVAGLLPQGDQDHWDFDDVVMLINRVFERAVTPYLVLHDDEGMPSGLYDLARDIVIEAKGSSRVEHQASSELKVLTAEFKKEWIEDDFHDEDFTTGLRVVAIPYIPERRVGVVEAGALITKLGQALL